MFFNNFFDTVYSFNFFDMIKFYLENPRLLWNDIKRIWQGFFFI